MPLIKLSDGRYAMRWYIGGRGGTRRYKTLKAGTSYEDARRIYKQTVAQASVGTGDSLITFRELATEYAEIHLPKLTAGGRERAESIIDSQLVPEFGSRVVARLRPADVERWRMKRQTDVSAATINREWTVLKAILNFGERLDLIDRNPIKRRAVALLKASPGRLVYFTPEEWRAFIAAFDDPKRWQEHMRSVRRFGPTKIGSEHDTPRRFGAGRKPDGEAAAEYLTRLRAFVPLLSTLLHTGARVGEIVSLRWEDVDLKGGTLRLLQSKTNAAKHLPISDDLKSIFEALPRGIGKAFVFARPDGSAHHPVEVRRAFKVAQKIAKIRPELIVHSIRHTFASWLVEAGTPLRTVQELLGHADIRMTIRYAHLSPAHKSDAVAKIGAIARESGTS